VMDGWIGVDLDGTLAKDDGFKGPEVIGVPVEKMLKRVKSALAGGKSVRVFTARVAPIYLRGENRERVEEARAAKVAIEKWCREHIGRRLPVTAVKDWECIEIWDDRCRQVKENTGEFVGGDLEDVAPVGEDDAE